jgi:hypothetical protein
LIFTSTTGAHGTTVNFTTVWVLVFCNNYNLKHLPPLITSQVQCLLSVGSPDCWQPMASCVPEPQILVSVHSCNVTILQLTSLTLFCFLLVSTQLVFNITAFLLMCPTN